MVVAVVAVPGVAGAVADRVEHAVDPALDAPRLVAELHAVFAPDARPDAGRTTSPPLKSATLLVREYDAVRAALPPDVVGAVEAWLGGGGAPTQVLETAHFRFTYATEGADAVPAEDVAPADGVPDFVARLAAWGETSWARLVDDAGFAAPLRRDGRVDVGFRAMAAYGYTRVVGGVPAILLHRDFAGFPDNDDPDGSAAGCAKVTIAHELKHASQFASSGWTEGGWLEADATWAEDFVFDATDDYLRFLAAGSPISDPGNWLPVSYEDCLFPKLLEEVHGAGVLVDFFARRAAFRSEPVLASYDAVLHARGSSVPEAVATLGLWAWFSGAHADGRPAGFEEADRYPTAPVAALVEDDVDGLLAPLGSAHLLATAAGRSGRPLLSFAGDPGTPFAVWTVTLGRDGRRDVDRVPLAGASSAALDVARDWEDLATLVVIVSNGSAVSGAGYGIIVDSGDAVASPELAAGARFAVLPNRPNPFRDGTTIRFSLPSRGAVTVSVHDAAGRLVRRVLDGAPRDAGLHEAAWDARDNGGRPVAPGLYLLRVESAGLSAGRKMLVVR